MKSVLATCLSASLALVAACASPSSHRTQFPSRISEAKLPTVEPLATEIARSHHGKVTSKLKMCVAASGDVEGVTLVSSSGLAAYDDAVVAAVSDWRYQAPAAPACQKLDVSYRTP